jgi:nucleotide-binding universal stress UspA family protein
LKSILLATDFAPASTEALSATLQLASKTGATVHLLHVLEPMPQWPVALHELRERASVLMEPISKRFAEQRVQLGESRISIGSPPEVILQTASDCQADLIAIGSGKFSAYDQYSTGPVAGAVLEHARQAVLAARPGGQPLQFKNILCPVDQSEASARGLRTAARLATVFGSQLAILTVVPEVDLPKTYGRTAEFADAQTIYESQWRQEFETFLDEHPESSAAILRDVRSGRPYQQIAAAAVDHKSDLIVMGATGRSGLARILLGSTTRRLLPELPCSLLAVKSDELFAGM